MRKSVLFLIPTLDRGGAENVLVDLVNNMDQERFKITVQTLFDQDSQKSRLREGIEYKTFLYKQFRGNSRLMALIPAKFLYRMIVKERYDIVVSYLEGPTTHIISGCPYEDSRTVAWMHTGIDKAKQMAAGFVSVKAAAEAYREIDRTVFVSEEASRRFLKQTQLPMEKTSVLYNTIESGAIQRRAEETAADPLFDTNVTTLISVGKIADVKGYDRLARIHKRLIEDGVVCHTYIIGSGPEVAAVRRFIEENRLGDSLTLLGYRDNPYKYVARADLYVCSSRREGFSTAVTEALIVGTPVITTEVSGMREMLGDNEYGVITENDEEALYRGIKRLLDDPTLLAHYREKAAERGRAFITEKTVKAVEEMLLEV